jgi:hypothetical protein
MLERAKTFGRARANFPRCYWHMQRNYYVTTFLLSSTGEEGASQLRSVVD